MNPVTQRPLHGVNILELQGMGPVPFCTMMMADLGANVIRVDRKDAPGAVVPDNPIVNRGRRSIVIDLKSEGGASVFRDLVRKSHVLIEGYRPGVAERLGVGPDVCHALNPELVYARLTGWGQSGRRSQLAGHDINYIAATGALHAIGETRPVVPLNIIGDYAGGSALAFGGIMAALLNVAKGAKCQVVDSAMAEGVSYLLSFQYGLLAQDAWKDQRSVNLLDGSHPLYRVYECRCGDYMAVGALESRFANVLFDRMGEDDLKQLDLHDPAALKTIEQRLEQAFLLKDRDAWATILEDSDCCATPVLSLLEARDDPGLADRNTFRERQGLSEPAPSPRFSFSAAETLAAPASGQHTRDILDELGYGIEKIDELLQSAAVSGGEE
ncbi:CoA transferase [Alcaligenaceae bacterium]|nr:CoA transferase [Alcaligenaceae bacterium]